MRIALVTTSYPAWDGDPSGHFVHAEAIELRREGHEVVVVRPRTGGAFGWPGVVARLRESPLRAVEACGWTLRAAREVAALDVERVIAHWSVPCGLPICAATKAALEVVSHGADVRLLLGLGAALRSRLVMSLARRVDRWRFVSDALLTDLRRALDGATERALADVAIVLPSPIVMLDVEAQMRRRRKELHGRRLYVCAGRLVPSKRIDKVIDYVATEAGISAARERVLVVLGDGPERPNLERVANAWRIDVRFLGTRPRAEALAWIGAADEVVHASASEGLSTVVREAERLSVLVTVLA